MQIRQRVGGQADRRRVFSHLLDLADCLGAKSVQIVLDYRRHPAQSVLQPSLAALQGPAVLLHMEGVSLGADQLCRLQNLPVHRQGLPRRYPRAGPGLLAAYQLTDVLQVSYHPFCCTCRAAPTLSAARAGQLPPFLRGLLTEKGGLIRALQVGPAAAQV